MRLITLAFILLVPSTELLGQIIEPDQRPLNRGRVQELTRGLLEAASRTRAEALAIEDSIGMLFEQKMSDDDRKSRLTQKLAQATSVPAQKIDTLLETTKELRDRGPSGGVAMTTEGNLKTNIQAYRFVIAEQSLKIPMYFSIAPEVLLGDGNETEESKARRVMDLTGGNLGVAIKRYFGLWPRALPDASLRAHAQLAGNFTSSGDSTNTATVSGGVFQLAGGLNMEAKISGDGSGFIWIEGSAGYSWFAGDAQQKVFATAPANSFFHVSIVGRILVLGLVDIQGHYYKGWNSNIGPIDRGFGMVTFGLTTSLGGN